MIHHVTLIEVNGITLVSWGLLGCDAV